MSSEVRKYLRMRKSVQKAMKKAISSLKDNTALSTLGEDKEAAAFVSLLREAEAAPAAAFETVFCLISGARQLRSGSNWSLLSKVMLKKKRTPEEAKVDCNGFSKQDMALESLDSRKTSKVHSLAQVEQLQNGVKNLSLDIQDLEEGLEILYRRLIKSRVSLLNILNK